MLVGGSMLLCGQYMGKNQLDRTRNIYAMDVVISLPVSALIILVCVLGVVTGFTRTMTDNPVVLQQLNRYTLGMMIGIVPTILSQKVSAFLSLENQTKRTTIGSVAFIVVNLILDADNYYNALNRNACVLLSYRNGKKIAESSPAEKKVLF